MSSRVTLLTLLASMGLASSPARADETPSRGITGGLDLGVGIPAGGSALFGPGLGTGVSLGFRSGPWRLQARIFEGYDLRIDSEAGQVLDGELDPASMTIERAFDLGTSVVPVLGVGPAMVSTAIAGQNDAGFLVAKEREGVGLALTAGLEMPMGRSLSLTINARSYLLSWERVGEVIVHDGDENMLVTGIDPKDGMPLSISVGLSFFAGKSD